MKVLVFNCGSSSLKYKLLEMPSARMLAGGEAQRVGPPTAQPACIYHRTNGDQQQHQVDMPNHAVAFQEVMKLLTSDTRLAPDAVGHRMVHGGTRFADHAIVDEAVIGELEAIQDLAPLHNPPATALVRACQSRYPHLPQVVVFDTAFHAAIPDYAYTYALPRDLMSELGIRKYGFHGTSHQYVVEEAARLLDRPLDEFNAVSCHLGSGGASLCAVVNGRSVDNTMGYSPLQGLMMSTRCGDLDPAVALQLLTFAGGDGDSVENLLNKRSGVLGMSGMSADIRDVLASVEQDADASPRLRRTVEAYVWRIRKYLGSYLATVGSADAIIFTDTIGETSPQVRWAVCAGMEVFGVSIDPARNIAATHLPADVARDDSKVRILAIQTNEELAIARRTFSMLSGAAGPLQKEH
ncbi:MAG TPA: acetate kinase [Phycisphaerae bacterium]|nr:acetate kinase [Phycisphaerae bacterium]